MLHAPMPVNLRHPRAGRHRLVSPTLGLWIIEASVRQWSRAAALRCLALRFAVSPPWGFREERPALCPSFHSLGEAAGNSPPASAVGVRTRTRLMGPKSRQGTKEVLICSPMSAGRGRLTGPSVVPCRDSDSTCGMLLHQRTAKAGALFPFASPGLEVGHRILSVIHLQTVPRLTEYAPGLK